MKKEYFDILRTRGAACPYCGRKSVAWVGYGKDENGEFVVTDQLLSCDSQDCKEKAGNSLDLEIEFVDKTDIESVSAELDRLIEEALKNLQKSCSQPVGLGRFIKFVDPPQAQ